MQFELLPVLDAMLQLYEQPRNIDRFRDYLQLLQGGSKGEMHLPIGGFNPMAKSHVQEALLQLKNLDAEQIASNALQAVNKTCYTIKPGAVFNLALNLSDDVQGGWTNRYSSDYDSKFRFHGLMNKGFTVAVFWVSESFSKTLIETRVLEYLHRTIYWLRHGKPLTLQDHLAQELYVAKQLPPDGHSHDEAMESVAAYYRQYANTEDYGIIFNFFYGDEASVALGMPCYGTQQSFTGFEYAKGCACM